MCIFHCCTQWGPPPNSGVPFICTTAHNGSKVDLHVHLLAGIRECFPCHCGEHGTQHQRGIRGLSINPPVPHRKVWLWGGYFWWFENDSFHRQGQSFTGPLGSHFMGMLYKTSRNTCVNVTICWQASAGLKFTYPM